jgi:DNA repair ATPase RecN
MGRDKMLAQAVSKISGVPERPNDSSAAPQQIDAAGEAIRRLLNKASHVTEANNRRAAEIAENAMQQLRAAEEGITSLQSEAQFYREEAEEAEKWLARIYEEIEHLFIRKADAKRVGR